MSEAGARSRNPERSLRRISRKKERAKLISQPGSYLCRQLPTLPHTFACSTIGPAGLNFRVRDGNGWNPRGKITDKSKQLVATSAGLLARFSGAPDFTLRCRIFAAILTSLRFAPRSNPNGLEARSQKLRADFSKIVRTSPHN